MDEFIEKIIVERNKAVDGIICEEIQKIATENGVTTKITLNEKVIVLALEKQIPQKPTLYDKHYFKCPCCSKDLGIDEDGLYVYKEIPPPHCMHCGQKLDWSDSE